MQDKGIEFVITESPGYFKVRGGAAVVFNDPLLVEWRRNGFEALGLMAV